MALAEQAEGVINNLGLNAGTHGADARKLKRTTGRPSGQAAPDDRHREDQRRMSTSVDLTDAIREDSRPATGRPVVGGSSGPSYILAGCRSLQPQISRGSRVRLSNRLPLRASSLLPHQRPRFFLRQLVAG